MIFDELHQGREPGRVLKVTADASPRLKILATGSSARVANRTFGDTLAGRNRRVPVVPLPRGRDEGARGPVYRAQQRI